MDSGLGRNEKEGVWDGGMLEELFGLEVDQALADIASESDDAEGEKELVGVDVLEKYREAKPSLTIHVYSKHFKFDNQDTVYSFSSPIAQLIGCIGEGRLPADLLEVIDETGLQYYDGCLIVEMHIHPGAPRIPCLGNGGGGDGAVHTKRIALRPTPHSLWRDISIRNNQLLDEMPLAMEERLLLSTSHHLCLDPSTQVVRLRNTISWLRNPARHTKRRKVLNSSEKAALKNKQKDNLNLMKMMDNRSEIIGRRKNSNNQLGNRVVFIDNWYSKTANEDKKVVATVDNDAAGDQMVMRTIRFERYKHNRKNKIYTVLNVYYSLNGGYECLLCIGEAKDTSYKGHRHRFYFPNEHLLNVYVITLLNMYGCYNEVVCDIMHPSNEIAAANNKNISNGALFRSNIISNSPFWTHLLNSSSIYLKNNNAALSPVLQTLLASSPSPTINNLPPRPPFS